MHLNKIDLNLLRLFDAVYRLRNVSHAALHLGLTQPAVSQGLTRLRVLLHDPLFVRASGGVAPSPRAERLASTVQAALGLLEGALNESTQFEPLHSQRTFALHMSDIGESRFLPPLMQALQTHAPGVRLATQPWPRTDIAQALDRGQLDFAFGFLPSVSDTQRLALLHDRYVVLLRQDHPFVRRQRQRSQSTLLEALHTLEFVAVRSHSDSLRILQMQNLANRLRLTSAHFMALPAIVKASDLAAIMPREIARQLTPHSGFTIVEPAFALRDFTVSLHWSKRHETDAGNRWLRGLVQTLMQAT